MSFTNTPATKEKPQGYFNISIKDGAGNIHRVTGVSLFESKALNEALIHDAKAHKAAWEMSTDKNKGEYVPKVYDLQGSINLVDENPEPIVFG